MDLSRSAENNLPKSTNLKGYNYAIAVTKFYLSLLGSWPDPLLQSSLQKTLHFAMVAASMFFFTTLSQTVKMLQHLGDLNVLIEIFVNCNIPTTIAMVKLSTVWYHRNVFKVLLKQMIQDWARPGRDERESKIMWRHARLSRYFSVGCVFLNTATLFTQCVSNWMEPIKFVLKKNVTADWPLYFRGSFPYNTEVHPNYDFTVVAQWISNMCASLSFDASDSFFCVLMFHVIGQLSILKINIQNLTEGVNTEAEFVNKFRQIQNVHIKLWRFSGDIENCFNTMFLIQMIPCIFVLCTQGYMLIMIIDSDDVSFMELLFMVYFLLLFLFTIFAYCYVAETLRQKSLEISSAAYDCDWTTMPASHSKLLVLIIARAQNPFEITAGKFAIFSLELYCSILKTSAGYLSMLLAVKDRVYN